MCGCGSCVCKMNWEKICARKVIVYLVDNQSVLSWNDSIWQGEHRCVCCRQWQFACAFSQTFRPCALFSVHCLQHLNKCTGFSTAWPVGLFSSWTLHVTGYWRVLNFPCSCSGPCELIDWSIDWSEIPSNWEEIWFVQRFDRIEPSVCNLLLHWLAWLIPLPVTDTSPLMAPCR